jgi:DNA ligase (NAD+)
MQQRGNMALATQNLMMALPSMSTEDLEAEVRRHNRAYWDNDEPIITDEGYDRLVEALRKKNADSPALLELAGTPAASGPERRFATITHEQPMLSLEKCYDDKSLSKWREKIPGSIVVTPKIDGVACAIRYAASGKLLAGGTRGDGKKGDDITNNVRAIRSIPSEVGGSDFHGEPFEVRGEVFMALSRFQDQYADAFANPRNLAAGALKQKDSGKSASYQLSFFAYDVLGTPFLSEQEKNTYLTALGFTLPPRLEIDESEDLAEGFRHFSKMRAELDYETDGVVMKAANVALQKELGVTAHHPRYALAYKFQGESAQTTLTEIDWSVGRSGVITPVAVVMPVLVSGATVSRASLHHAGYLEKLGLTQEAQIEIARRGGVIPHVERVIEPTTRPYEIPENCPSCQGPTRMVGDFLYCTTPAECPDVLIGRLSYFTKTIDILGFGKKHLAAMVGKGMVRRLADLYRLRLLDLVRMDRMGEKLANRLLAELAAKRQLPPGVFLTALGIDEVGTTVAHAIVEHFSTLEKLRNATQDEVAMIHGVGDAIAESLVFALKDRSDEIDDLLTEVEVAAASPPPSTGHQLENSSVVFTGKMSKLDRKQAQKQVRQLGGKTPTSVTRDLTILVVGDEGSPLLGDGKKSTKQKTAEKYIEQGAPIEMMSESAFLLLLSAPADDNP